MEFKLQTDGAGSMLHRRGFVKMVGLGTAALAAPGWLTSCSSSGRRPNFVFILIDDLGWKDAGFMGSRYYETPNIDMLANRSVTFTDAYASAPNCAPSRASLMSGQYSPRHGVYTVNDPARGPAHLRRLIPTPNRRILDPVIVTIAEALKPAGYVSASVGKWHLGDDPQSGPMSQGFDVNIGGSLAEQMPDKRKELYDLLLGWRESVGAPVPTERNPLYNPGA